MAPGSNYGPRINFVGVNFDTTGFLTWPAAAAMAGQWYREDVLRAGSTTNDFEPKDIQRAMVETRLRRFAALPGRVQ